MFKRLLLLCLMVAIPTIGQAEQMPEFANYGEALKQTYKIDGGIFYDTERKGTGVSITCDMGQAIPDDDDPNWYTYSPIKGLKFSLKAVAVIDHELDEFKSMGFIIAVKEGDVLKTFKPVGDYVGEIWDGDVFNS